MPTCTPIYGLEYTVGSDRPCDQGSTWCDFAATVESNLSRLEGIVDRTVDTIPFAHIQASVSQVIQGNGRVSFDTVLADTENMVDLSNDSTLITIKRTGTWCFSFSATVPTRGSGAIGQAAFSSATAADGWVDNGATSPYFPSFSAVIRVVTVPSLFGDVTTPALVRISCSSGVPTTVTAASLTVAWMGDE